MTGAPARLLTWLAVMATLLTACTPAVDLTETDAGQSPASSSAPSTTDAVEAVPSTSATQNPVPPQPAPPPPAVPQAFALNLYQEGDFVPQYTFDWCVAASIQMAHNLIDDTGGGTWTSSAQQSELWEMARARSSNSFNGANPRGWAQVLTEVGMGPYSVVSIAGYEDALQTASRAIAETGRPVGLVMWSGRHAWVMSGFESVGDPAQFPEFQVTGVRVLDPLYPYGSGQWGPSPEPNSLLTPEQLAAQFVVREPRRWSSDLPTGYLLVLPVAA
ncbi:hypothetical protein [Paenarthrobacter aurescens]|uniref:Peptidase C39-like domain-containing protein n=1 Tax=Paenarthrobacter aurescens TaxID=43663 RepID=A0A4Y3NH88_PAEAU|nr:hypothetical protein [Paenarthrobacter aurescens]MDO6141839.1 hypothetical protein [Paenarthrobacter aurescens]MDO6149602.1 hypothetical protein [Paenarthrobacter aurescens]MDO6156888.1 hypothetical protein [Paenarthrobacter aurescens]MDO6160874.1 hypothetical protein [Paenarthrobacter aurescens]GEB21210.1 hypothetical protein AAU01_39650 [Paenarthrobacter aurescens]